MKTAKTVAELQEIYEEELKRKDEIIAKLREENHLLMKMSLKSTQERVKTKEQIEQLSKKVDS